MIYHAADSLRNGREVVLASVKNDGSALQYTSKVLPSDRELVLAAVKNYGSVLQYTSGVLRSDRELVLAAVENDGTVLQFVTSETLRASPEIAVAAVTTDRSRFRQDSWRLYSSVQKDGSALQYASTAIRSDRDVVLAAARNYPRSLQHAAEGLCDDKTVIIVVVENNTYGF